MTDVLTPEQRRRCMSRIKSRNTTPELALRNRARDTRVNTQLAEQGWRVLRFWQHQIKGDMDGCVQTIESALAARGRSDKKRGPHGSEKQTEEAGILPQAVD